MSGASQISPLNYIILSSRLTKAIRWLVGQFQHSTDTDMSHVVCLRQKSKLREKAELYEGLDLADIKIPRRFDQGWTESRDILGDKSNVKAINWTCHSLLIL